MFQNLIMPPSVLQRQQLDHCVSLCREYFSGFVIQCGIGTSSTAIVLRMKSKMEHSVEALSNHEATLIEYHSLGILDGFTYESLADLV